MSRTARLRLRSAAKVTVAVTTLGLAGACSNLFGPEKSEAVPYSVYPAVGFMVVGDTATFSTITCPAGGDCRDRAKGNVVSNWTIAGPSVTGIAGDGTAIMSTVQKKRIVVRATATGVTHIAAASSHDSTEADTVRVRVVDSAAITAIDVWEVGIWGPANNTSTVGTTVMVYGMLKDAQRNTYTTKPTQWLVSDSTIIRLVVRKSDALYPTRDVTMLKAGTADVIVRFHGIENRLRMTVVPR